MQLSVVPPHFVDKAWKDGAACLSEACDTSGGEIEGPQLKMMLSRGERTLVRLDDEDKAVGWGVFRIDPLPNMRVLHIAELVCRNAHFERFFDELESWAKQAGCIEVRWSAKEAQARLYRIRLKRNIEAVYTTYRVKL